MIGKRSKPILILEYAVPPYETSPSFPSGHTLNSTVIASLVSYRAPGAQNFLDLVSNRRR
ncbi:MAG TPA: hypothetical protein VJW23_07105 [Propionibacteriaceae bacterium]|nr:hypothetical protein [Propionibacteriaceae bacterium]